MAETDPVSLDNKVVIITGAGGGLGRCHALLMAQRGARIVVNDLGGTADGQGSDESAANKVVAEIESAGGVAVANHDSVATADGGEAIVQAALDAYGQVDVVVNNAGILRDMSFAKMTPEAIDGVVDVHLKGAFFVSRPAYAAMKEQGYGRFIHTTSAAGLFGNFGQTNYAAAKMGLVGLSNVIAVEGKKYNINSNVIAPLAKTRMTEELMGPMADSVQPEQVSGLVTYLASEQCELSHEVFSVGGGRIARVFVGLGPGWFGGKGHVPTPEDVVDNLDAIRATEPCVIPDDASGEMMAAREIFS
ncbi:MAG: SDR family oxidoreductase [Actinomycetia bacterium]|nr:SDR family oxidoreductase [Actinomycetes bacterium]